MDVESTHRPREEGSETEDASRTFAPRDLSPRTLRIHPLIKGSELYDEDYEPEDEKSAPEDSADEDNVSPLKRAADDTEAHRPLKRQKGLLNNDYLSLLNTEIQDAAQRISVEDMHKLPLPSQFGLSYWSSIEKQIFFESIARLGRDDLDGIAARVGSKSTVEIRHYIHALEDEHARRIRTDRRPALTNAEYPAAVELSQQCCHALDEAADAISLRQERREQQREESKWGTVWDLTPDFAKRLQEGEKNTMNAHDLPSVDLFHLSSWLRLSQRFFMNSSIPANNWNHIDDVPPSIWATTFEDFRSLAVSITRRLVQTAIFAASTRIRSKREHRPVTRNIVKRKDIEAAIASLGMPTDSKEFWRTSARRLRLDVFDDLDESEVSEPMTFEEVEGALSEEVKLNPTRQPNAGEHVELKSSSDEPSAEETASEDVTDESDEEERAINTEANEVFRFSVADFPETFRMKQALSSRVAMEREQEKFAEDSDQYASCREELEMWELLQKPPPLGLPKKSDPGPAPRSNLDVESLYPLGRDWRGGTQYVSDWEVAPKVNEEGR